MNELPGELIDAYCERKTDGLYAEPLNAISSLTFIIAAILLIQKFRKLNYTQAIKWESWLLILLLLAIGVGSTSWHIFARDWAKLTDILPITLFLNVFLLSFLIRIAQTRWWQTLIIFTLFQLANFLSIKLSPTDFLNGSMFYVAAWAALVLVVIFLFTKNHYLKRSFTIAITLLTVSIFLRSIDQEVCTTMPIGTHFLWHIINAVVLYILLLGLIRATTQGRLQN